MIRTTIPETSQDYRILRGKQTAWKTYTPAMFNLVEEIEVAAGHHVTILLVGETGSGKTHLAKLIHEISPHHNQPFVTIACGALQSDLIESELFGHVKGAFTGAETDRQGKFEAAGSGTILLDEIDVLNPDQQTKLLRVIEMGEFEPVGSNQTKQNHARIVVASNYKLEELVQQGVFRTDLYYRLNTLRFNLLPLRDRIQDILPLAQEFIHRFCREYQIKIQEIHPNFFNMLCHYHWPGNIRELENVLRRVILYAKTGKLSEENLIDLLAMHEKPFLSSRMIGNQIGSGNSQKHSRFPSPSFELTSSEERVQEDLLAQFSEVKHSMAMTLEAKVDLFEQQLIEDCLLKNNQQRKKTAADLGISRVTLYNKMRKFGLM